MNKKLFALIAMLVFLVTTAQSCGSSAETTTRNFVNQQQEWYRKYQPLPFYTYSLELAEAIQIYNARNEARATNTFTFSMTGNVLFSCPSRGFPLPYGVQLTNSEAFQEGYASYGALPQAEPNGLYTNTATTSATWFLCSRADGLAAVYSEPEVMSFPFPVIEQNGRIVDIGEAASFIIDLTRPETVPTSNPAIDPSIPQR